VTYFGVLQSKNVVSCILYLTSISKHFVTDNHLQKRQSEFLRDIKLTENHPFVFRLRSNCGQECHDELESVIKLHESTEYGIINSDHALVYTDLNTAKSMYDDAIGGVEEFVPFLPELKIDAEVDVGVICENSKDVAINIIFFEMTHREVESLKQELQQSDVYRVRQGDVDALEPSVDNIVSITVRCDAAPDVITAFSERSSVQWIERSYDHLLLTRYANGVVQSGDPDVLPLHAANLTGAGQIIGIADTGLDAQSCFFYDEEIATPYNYIDKDHRKIIYYKTVSNNVDFSGHGTLVSSVAAGKCRNEKSVNFRYNGAAYDAKISFLDVGSGVLAEDGSEYINAGSNHYKLIYEVLYDSGSSVMSMSWGTSSNAYTAQAR
jgi:hypothetical protein